MADWLLPAAAIGSSLVGGLFGNRAASRQADAAAEGTAAQIAMGREALGEQRRQFDLNRADLAPYRDAGVNALRGLSAWLPFDGTGFVESPDYAYRYNEGVRGINADASARGLLNSGSRLRALQDRGQQIASGEYANWFARNAGLNNQNFNQRAAVAGIGQAGTNAGVSAGTGTTNAMSNILTGMGNAQAMGAQQTGAAHAGAMNNWGNAVNSGINNALYWYASQR